MQMKVIRKKWTKDSLIEFLGVKHLYDANPKCKILCHNDGCLFEVELRECNLSYVDISHGLEDAKWEAYWEYACPVCGEMYEITKRDFKLGKRT